MNYKTIKLGNNATLRVATDKIIATITKEDSDYVTLYINGMSRPLELPVIEHTAKDINEYIFMQEK